MKKYPHQVFLAENKLKTEQLPKQLQKRIKGFEELQEDLEHAVDDDHDRLAKKLVHLSLELEEDLYEEFEDQLENNEEQDELQPGSLYSFSDGFTWKIVSKKEAKALFNKNQEVFGLNTDEETEGAIEELSDLEAYEVFAVEYKAPKTSGKANSDEAILDQLYAKGKREIARTDLQKMGFKTPLEAAKVKVGKYTLYKAMFSYTYTIKR